MQGFWGRWVESERTVNAGEQGKGTREPEPAQVEAGARRPSPGALNKQPDSALNRPGGGCGGVRLRPICLPGSERPLCPRFREAGIPSPIQGLALSRRWRMLILTRVP